MKDILQSDSFAKIEIASLKDDEGTIKMKQRRMPSREVENNVHCVYCVSASNFKQFVTFSRYLEKGDCLETQRCSFRGSNAIPENAQETNGRNLRTKLMERSSPG